jgi:hypothetical protein
VEGKFIFRRVLGKAFTLLTSPDSVTMGTFFFVNIFVLSGVITFGDWEVAGLFTPCTEIIEVFVLFTAFRCILCGLILF